MHEQGNTQASRPGNGGDHAPGGPPAGDSGKAVGPTALITGASSGIGLELARLLAAESGRLVLVARGEQRLRELAEELSGTAQSPSVTVLPLDLSHRDAPERLTKNLEDAGLQVDTLINNAGFGLCGNFWELPAAQQEQLITVNIQALVGLTRLLLPGMIQRRRGAVLNMGSLAGFQPGPGMAVYFASKAFVNSFTEALAEELRPYPEIRVSCLCPGPTATSFGERSGMDNALIFKFGTMDARKVAEQGLRALRRGKAIHVSGLHNWVIANSSRFTPRFLMRRITARLNQPL